MFEIAAIVLKLLPVVLLIVLGWVLQQVHFFEEKTIDDLKKVVIYITLPAMLFLTFSKTTFKMSYLFIVISIFFTCTLLLLAGIVINKSFVKSKYAQTLFTGCETGLVGYAMFGMVYGNTDIFKLAVIDIGNSIFINVLLLSYIKHLNKETISAKQTAVSIFKTPTVLAVLAGIIASGTGLNKILADNIAASSVLNTMTLVGNITTPLICIILGYSMHLDLKYIKKPLLIALTRMALSIAAASAIYYFLFSCVLHLDKTFDAALFSMFILPPAFVLPIFIKNSREEEEQLVLNTIAISTLLSIAVFPVLVYIFK